MMRIPIITIATACLLLMSHSYAMSQSHAEQNPRTTEEVERVFDSIDRDQDNRISKREGERAEVIRDRFNGVDADQDGYLSRAEYRARPRRERFE